MQRPRLYARTTTAIRELYHLDPVLWAVVKGNDTPEQIAQRLSWSPHRTDSALNRSFSLGHIRYFKGKLRPTDRRHMALRKSWLDYLKKKEAYNNGG